MVLPVRLVGRGAIALRSIGGGLPVGFKTVYKGSSAAAAVPAQANAIPKRLSFTAACGTVCEGFVSHMPISPNIRILQRGPSQCNRTESRRTPRREGLPGIDHPRLRMSASLKVQRYM